MENAHVILHFEFLRKGGVKVNGKISDTLMQVFFDCADDLMSDEEDLLYVLDFE